MALTQQEIKRHLGEMLVHGFDNHVRPVSDDWTRKLIRLAKLYVQEGSVGTEADRLEAMVTVRRKLFAKLTGLDPVVDAHAMTHFIRDAEDDN